MLRWPPCSLPPRGSEHCGPRRNTTRTTNNRLLAGEKLLRRSSPARQHIHVKRGLDGLDEAPLASRVCAASLARSAAATFRLPATDCSWCVWCFAEGRSARSPVGGASRAANAAFI